MNIAFIGAGQVGAPLAARLAEAGHAVVLAESKGGSATVSAALKRSARLSSRPLTDAVRDVDVVFLATPSGVLESVLGPLAESLAGKVLVDCTNPVGPGLTHGLKSERSGSCDVTLSRSSCKPPGSPSWSPVRSRARHTACREPRRISRKPAWEDLFTSRDGAHCGSASEPRLVFARGPFHAASPSMSTSIVRILSTKHVRLRGGARADLLFFDVDDHLGNFIPAFSKKTHILGFRRTANGIAFGPRVTLEGDPLPWARLSASYGEGYRSPQARQLEEGEQAPFATVKSYEAGATVRDGDRIALTAAAYETDLSYDLAFDPTTARLERIGPTTRRGLVGHVLASPSKHATISVSATYVHATLDSPPLPTPENPTPAYTSGEALPYVPPLVIRSDVGFTGSLGRVAQEEVSWRVGYGTTFLSPRPKTFVSSGGPRPDVRPSDYRSPINGVLGELALE